MTASSAQGRLGRASAEGRPRQAGDSAPFGATLALTVVMAVACFAIVMSLVLLVVPAEPLTNLSGKSIEAPDRLAKAVLYLATFAAFLPLALVGAQRLAGAVAAGPNGSGLPALAALLAASLVAVILAVRVSSGLPWGDGLGAVLAAVAAWCVAAAAVAARAVQHRPWPWLLGLERWTSALSLAAGALVLGVLVGTTSSSVSPLPVALGVVAVPAVLFLYRRGRPQRLPRGWAAAADATIVVILLLAVPDLVVFPEASFKGSPVITAHHDYLLGPTNQVLGGDALLVDAPVSQYGVGVIYFLAGWFQLAPIGHGTYALLDGLLTALLFAASYALLRIAGASRLLAGSAMAVAVVALIYELRYSVGALPQLGPLRFGLPMAIILPWVMGTRWPRMARAARAIALVVVGVASIWAVETFLYTLATFAALVCWEAWLTPHGSRVRWLARQAGLAALACLCAHLVFAVATLAVSGELPHWGRYLDFVNALLIDGSQAEFAPPYAPWSPDLAVAAGYVASAAAIVLLLRRRAEVARHQAPALAALVGTTAYGVALFSYANSRSATYLLLYLALPALLAGTLWLHVLLRAPPEVSARTRLAGLGLALSLAVLLLAAAWPAIGDRLPRSALGHAYPGGGLSTALDELWASPVLDPRAPAGERLLNRYMPRQRRALVLLSAHPELSTEILMRSGRADLLPVGDPVSESWIGPQRVDELRPAVAHLRPGLRVLTDQDTVQLLSAVAPQHTIDPDGKACAPGWTATSNSFDLEQGRCVRRAALEVWILHEIGKQFHFRIVHREGDYVIADLAAGSEARFGPKAAPPSALAVRLVYPPEGATGVAAERPIAVTFSQPMNKAVTQRAFSLRRARGDPTTGSFSWFGTSGLVFRPAHALAAGAQYTATVSTAAEDLRGHRLAAAKVWKFTVRRK